jgi:hypothetical protein
VKQSALDFRDQNHSFECPRKDELDEELQKSFSFLDEMVETGEVVENARRLRVESASKGRICRKSDGFC